MDTDTVRILMEAGYLATGSGRHREAREIFQGVMACRPESEIPLIGLAVTSLNAGDPEEAIRLLRDDALGLNPDSCLAKGFLGLALKLAGYNQEATTVLEEVVSKCDSDQAALNLARALLSQ